MQLGSTTLSIAHVCYGRIYPQRIDLIVANQPSAIAFGHKDDIAEITKGLMSAGFVITGGIVINPQRVVLIQNIRDAATIYFDTARQLMLHIDLARPVIEAVNRLDIPTPAWVEEVERAWKEVEEPEMPRVPDQDPDDAALANPAPEEKPKRKKASAK